MNGPSCVTCNVGRCFAALALLCVVSVGCSGRPAAIRPPDIEPDDVAAAAVERYDSNHDGTIDQKELESAPSLRFSLARLDSDGDGKLTAEEIEAFAQKQWVDRQIGMMRLRCEVMLDGQPVDGAIVSLEPESFMGGAINPATGVTSAGSAKLDISDEHRPGPQAHGVQNGLYLVRVSRVVNGQEQIPAKYNANTTLGCEVAMEAPYMPGPLVLELTKR